jgi:hypothetical protein
VEIYDERPWRKKHLASIRQNYANAPYLSLYFPGIEAIYEQNQPLLAEFTTTLISFFLDALSLDVSVVRQSQLGVSGKGTDLLVDICRRLRGDRLLTLPGAVKHIDKAVMKKHGIEMVRADFRPPVYPQLWGDFIYNLSILDLLLNCGPRSREIVAGANPPRSRTKR